jgi:microcystin-dependent protein
MADPFVAEIRIFPFNFAPRGWAWCDGQLMPLSQNTALFSLLGTTYGGNGKSNFALPDLQGRAPMHQGQGPGLSLHDLGETGGSETVTLLESETPGHAHAMNGQGSNSNLNDPANAVLARPFGGGNLYKTPAGAPVVALSDQSIAPAGSDQPHNNLMPYLTLYFCIALQGVYPPRG